jgi:hypothetical protein
MYHAEDVFELLNYYGRELALDYLVEIRKHGILEGEEIEKPKRKERTMTVLKLPRS